MTLPFVSLKEPSRAEGGVALGPQGLFSGRAVNALHRGSWLFFRHALAEFYLRYLLSLSE